MGKLFSIKKFFASIVFILSLLCVFICKTYAFSGSGSGTFASPYLITTAAQLSEIKDSLTAYYKINTNIDLQNAEFIPIGTSTVPFKGTLDGGNYTISNLKITRATTIGIGIFAYTDTATIKNIKISNANVSGANYTGALIGSMKSGIMEDCSIFGTGQVKGSNYVGGLVGTSILGSITNCNSAIYVEANTGAGGIVGQTTGNVNKCYAIGNIYVSSGTAGGLIGVSGNGTNVAVVSECYAVGNITGNGEMGGLIGSVSGTLVQLENCFAISSLNYTGTSVTVKMGGLIGYYNSSKSAINCYFAGKTEGLGNYLTGPNSTSCYYDGIKAQYIPKMSTDNPKLTSAMVKQTTYVGWDFTNKWTIDNGTSYPYLKNLPKPSQVNVSTPIGDVAGGSGTAADPFLIQTAAQLNNIKYDPYSFYKITASINLQNIEFVPIGTSTVPFKGTVDGNNYTISNLKITRATTNGVGIFAYTNSAIIKNIKISNADVSGFDSTGVLIGSMRSGTIDNCSIKGTGQIKGNNSVGGLVGINYTGNIANCNSTIYVEANSSIGGIVGQTTGSVSKCYATGNVYASTGSAGGLIGVIAGDVGEVAASECYATGNITGMGGIGGLIGSLNAMAKAENCFSTGDLTRIGTNTTGKVGGLIGSVYVSTTNKIINCYSTGKLQPSPNYSYTGGITNDIYLTSIISCYYDGVKSQYIPRTQIDFSKLTSAMTKQATYISWDFTNIWTIDNGTSYPYLKSLPKPSQANVLTPIGDVAGGSGTTTDPFLIQTADQLNNIKYDLTSCYKLTANINLQNVEHTPIGSSTMPFKGTFDGGNYTINNLKITKTTNDTGLFGYTDTATIKNLFIGNVDISGGYNTGGLIGTMKGGFIDNCVVTGTGQVKGTNYVGGLVGIKNTNGIVNNCVSTINIQATLYGGGLIGSNIGQVSKCFATGNVTNTSNYAGGLIGITSGASEIISECYASGNVTGLLYNGGLIGHISSTSTRVENCYSAGEVTAAGTSTTSYTAGLIGYVTNNVNNKVTNCYSLGKVKGTGALAGLNGTTYGTVTSCYFDSTITSIATPTTQARTSQQLKQQATFINWDFNTIWLINEGNGSPILKNLLLAPPADLTASTITDKSITLTWNVVPNATSYEIMYNGQVLTTSQTSITISNLSSNTVYVIKVKGKNSIVDGVWSSPLSIMTYLPQVSSITCTLKSKDSISLKWNTVSGATSYEVIYNGITVNPTTNSITVNNLASDTEYTFKIRAKTTSNVGIWSSNYIVRTIPLVSTQTYKYDKNNRLLYILINGREYMKYVYDDNGNLLRTEIVP